MAHADRPPMRGTLADRTYIRTSSVGVGITALWALAFGAVGVWDLAALGIATCVAILVISALRFRLGYPLATRLSVAADYVMLTAAAIGTGGMDGSLAIMLILLPAGPALALGIRECIRWGVVVAVTGAVLWWWEWSGGSFVDLTPEGYDAGFRATAQLSVLVGTLIMLTTYAAMHGTARRRLQRSREDLERAHAELKLSQQQLLVTEKMAALGRVTAGMAHEINSTLAGATSAMEFVQITAVELRSALADPRKSPAEREAVVRELEEYSAVGMTALHKIAEFVRRMKKQTRPAEISTPFAPADEVASMLRLFQRVFADQGVLVHADTDRDARLYGDPSRFGQVVQNLVANAADAYDGARGEVWVRLSRSGGAVVLEVEDRGHGIPEEIRSHVFDYLFTTKGVGAGTGLGLALVHGVVTEHFGGTIEFTSEVGRGTSFRVVLPHRSEGPA